MSSLFNELRQRVESLEKRLDTMTKWKIYSVRGCANLECKGEHDPSSFTVVVSEGIALSLCVDCVKLISDLSTGQEQSYLGEIEALKVRLGMALEVGKGRGGTCATCLSHFNSVMHKTHCADGNSKPCRDCEACNSWTPGKERRCVNGFRFMKD